jgi:flagellar hook-associated protein 2
MDSTSSSYSTNSTSGAKFAIGGIISGLDTSSIISSLMKIESQSLTVMQNNKLTAQQQLVAWKGLDSNLTALNTATNTLATAGFTGTKTATSSDTTIATVSATSSAQEGSYDVYVKSLARANVKQASAGSDYDITTYGTGTITVKTGTTSVDVTIDSSNNTLQGMVKAINDSGADVNATFVNVGSSIAPSYKMLLTSKQTGTANNITVTTSSGITGLSFSDQQKATDAEIWVGDKGDTANNLKFVRSSNTIDDALPGITFNLVKVQASDADYINVKVNRDTSSAKTQITSFLNSVNSLGNFFSQQFYYDPTTDTQGTLDGNSTLMSMQSKIDDLVYGVSLNDGQYHNLAQIGITADSKGKLSIADQDKFNKALSTNPDDVELLFSDSTHGIATKMKKYIDSITQPQTGTVALMERQNQDKMDEIDKSITKENTYLAQVQADYEKQYRDLETALSTMKSQFNSISSTIASMSSSMLSSSG